MTSKRLGAAFHSGLAAVALAAPLAGCADRSAIWDTPFERGDTVGLTGSVAMVDKGRNELMMLTAHGEANELEVERIEIGKNIVRAQASRDRERLFVLSSGDERRLHASDQPPQLSVVFGGLAPRLEKVYELSDPLQQLALDPEGEWAVVYDAGGVVVNVNELILVNLAEPEAPLLPKTIRSTGGAPQRFTFTPPLTLANGERTRLLVVETSQDVAIIDLARADTSEFTVPLPRTASGQIAQPAQIAFHDDLPGGEVASYLAVRFSNDSSVLTLRLAPPKPAPDSASKLSLVPNLVDAGGLPSTVEFVQTDRGLRLAALVPSLSAAVLFDPASSKSERVQFDRAYSGIARVTNFVANAPENGDVALLYSNQVASIAFWRLGTASATPYASFDSYAVDTTVSNVLDVPGEKFAYLKLLVASNQREFFLLDLDKRESYPMHALDRFELRLSPDGQRAWAFQRGDSQFASLSFEKKHPASFAVEAPVSDVFDIERSGGGRSAVVLHAEIIGNSDAGVTLFDAQQPDSANTRFVSALMLEGL
jgi:hypothetical protein